MPPATDHEKGIDSPRGCGCMGIEIVVATRKRLTDYRECGGECVMVKMDGESRSITIITEAVKR